MISLIYKRVPLVPDKRCFGDLTTPLDKLFLLAGLHHLRQAGELLIDWEDQYIHMEVGQQLVLAAFAKADEFQFGKLLSQMANVKQEEIDEAYKAIKAQTQTSAQETATGVVHLPPSQRIGSLLVAAHLISPHMIGSVLRTQVLERSLRMIALEQCHYTFEPKPAGEEAERREEYPYLGPSIGTDELLFHALLWRTPFKTVTPWICLLASSIVHIFYFWSLANAYRYADLSFVYPYSRGIGALAATIIGLFLLNEEPSIIGGMGIGLTILATFLEPILSKGPIKTATAGIGLTIATGLAIASYLVIDKIGVGHMSPHTYLGILFAFITIGFAPTMLKKQRIRKEFLRSRHRLLIASLFMTSGYGVVLAAMTLSPVSYVVAARATGIVVSGIAGILFFSEAVSKMRWMSIGLITIGIFLIGMG